MKSKKSLIANIALITFLIFMLVMPVTFAVFTKDANSNGSYGEVYLRSYYHSGTGTSGDPFVITRPRHLYNLSRLQNLGVYQTKTYFQLGSYDLDDSNQPKCYLSDSDDTVVPFIDMSACSYTNEPIFSIGSEATPFYGEFDGQNLEIKNLTVYSDFEDSGLFGYTGSNSYVHNLFLDNITIQTLGYTSDFDNLYKVSTNSASAAYNAKILYRRAETPTASSASYDYLPTSNYEDAVTYARDGATGAVVGTPILPTIDYSKENSFEYEFLIAGDAIVADPVEGHPYRHTIDLDAVYEAFKEAIEYNETYSITTEYPLIEVASISLVASQIDAEGTKHSRVVSTLKFTFSLAAANATVVTMKVQKEDDHGNNIGLIIGHCDGAAQDCYVHDGKFVMNNGDTVTESTPGTYTSSSNHSKLGLIGIVGRTVHNVLAEESDGAAKEGLSVGALNFSTIYDSIIEDSSAFTSPKGGVAEDYGISYTPISGNQYIDALRKKDDGTYVTYQANTVSFNGQRVIKNTDLGVFTIATDSHDIGTGSSYAGNTYVSKCVVRKENESLSSGVAINGDYYVYYAMGEYNPNAVDSFGEYTQSLISDSPSTMFPGHYLPKKDQVTMESFAQRELYQNYVFRMKLDPINRNSNSRFYFSHLDDGINQTVGGSFLNKYFQYKLVDKKGDHIAHNSDLCGLMLRNPTRNATYGYEVDSFTASMQTPDFSNGDPVACIYNVNNGHPASNMINFEIKTSPSNVTIVAAQTSDKPAAIGIYDLTNENPTAALGGGYKYDIDYAQPDYAFFMPSSNQLTYFDYKADAAGNGAIGVYSDDGLGSWTDADDGVEATFPAQYGYDEEYGYSSGKTRLFAHTFCLPVGRYCIGSATGVTGDNTATSGDKFCTSKIFFVCAQGQTAGNYDIGANTFTSGNAVKDIDFLKVPRYTTSFEDHDSDPETPEVLVWDGGTNIFMGTPVAGESDSDRNKRLYKQRCYVALKDTERSEFKNELSVVSFKYSDSTFVISAPGLDADPEIINNDYLSTIKYMAVDNYGNGQTVKDSAGEVIVSPMDETALTNVPILLFNAGSTSSARTLRYGTSS